MAEPAISLSEHLRKSDVKYLEVLVLEQGAVEVKSLEISGLK